MSETPDIKPRSRDVTDGLEKAAARGMLRAVGMGDDDWVKPQIGVAHSHGTEHAARGGGFDAIRDVAATWLDIDLRHVPSLERRGRAGRHAREV